ncbi:MAG: hypothetical protein SGPRY_012199, partial [Prymnesium sp.]
NHASARGADSITRLEGATKRCAKRHAREASSFLCPSPSSSSSSSSSSCNSSHPAAVVFVASDDASVRTRLLESLSSLPHVKAVSFSSSFASSSSPLSLAPRGTRAGQLAAAADLLLLGRSDAIVRAGNRGFSSLSSVATAVEPKVMVELLVVHPCDEEGWWRKSYDCVLNLRSQPRMLMLWPMDNSAVERGRVGCSLYDASGRPRTMAQRVRMMGSLDQRCEDLFEMEEFNRKHPVRGVLATYHKPAESTLKSEL